MNNSEETLMEWRVHLASKKPIQASAVLLLTFLVATLGGFWLGHPLAGIVTFVILAGALSDYLFPVSYRLTDKKAEAKGILGSQSIEWARVKKEGHDENGIKLSPFAHPTRLDAFRGVYLRIDDNRYEILKIIKICNPTVKPTHKG